MLAADKVKKLPLTKVFSLKGLPAISVDKKIGYKFNNKVVKNKIIGSSKRSIHFQVCFYVSEVHSKMVMFSFGHILILTRVSIWTECLCTAFMNNNCHNNNTCMNIFEHFLCAMHS